MTFLCFSGALPASPVALRVGPVVLFKVYDLTLNTMKDAQEPGETTFHCHAQFTVEMAVHRGMNSILWPFEVALNTCSQHRGWLGSYGCGTV